MFNVNVLKVRHWYNRQNARIEDGSYRCIPVPGEALDDVINIDENGNLGYWLCEVLYRILPEEEVETAWSQITGIDVA